MRILHLEDNDADRELMRLSLKAGGVHCEIAYASSEAEFETALADRPFDLILSDYTIPGYSGTHALSVARQKRPDIPFLFLSGTIGEELAIESLRNGATDYVLKDRIARLVPAVRRAVREAGERRQRAGADQALRESEERFREMAENIQDVFWVASADLQRPLYVSPAYEHIWQRPRPEVGASWQDWVDAVVPEDREKLHSAREELADGAKVRMEYRIALPDGSVRWIEERGYPLFGQNGNVKRVLGVSADITERKELRSQLIQAQKMEAIGLLASGVAHDFNNMLSVITGCSELLLQSGGQPPESVGLLNHILTAGRRAGNLTRQLLVFSRQQATREQTLDLNEVVTEITEMLGRLLGERVVIEQALAPEPTWIRADRGMMEQVIVNLAVNARDAMRDGGTLSIQTRRVTLGEDAARHNTSARSGDFVCLRVCDTGCGIPPEILGRIFEPFFTTKAKGTGLGLATVFGIVQQHRGWTEVESTVGKGTCFSAYLPSLPVARPEPNSVPELHGSKGGTETLLLVEDETAVRICAAAILRHFGYRVLEAGTVEEALQFWEGHEREIALLLTDWVLPGRVTGAELAEGLRKKRPDLKVIVTTGYAPDMKDAAFLGADQVSVLNKPYAAGSLIKAVREALDVR